MFHEFPKSLYMAGDVEAEHVIVQDAEEEATKRAQGFCGAWEHGDKPKAAETSADVASETPAAETVAAAPVKRGRPRKVV